MRTLLACGKYILAGAATLAALASLDPAHAGVRVLHAFDLSDGDDPDGVLVEDSVGNLYGTTATGGSGSCFAGPCGTVFKLAPDGTESVLHSFTGRSDGDQPYGLIKDEAGNLYGTTAYGGNVGCDGHGFGCGTVFEVAPDGTETVLYAFAGGGDGALPFAGVIRDKAGNLYGTTSEGGNTDCWGYGCGTVFKLAPNGTETVLYAFTGGSDGVNPEASLIEDSAGNLYGTTYSGGTGFCTFSGCGTVFKIAPDGTKTTLYSFKGGTDGTSPLSALIAGGAGKFYGTTWEGGGGGCIRNSGCGTVFELAADGTETVLHAFADGSDGALPFAGLIEDKAGNLYGTTEGGGSGSCGGLGCGTIFKVARDGTETVLHAFLHFSHGYDPEGGLMQDKEDHLIGTTFNGGIRTCFGWPDRSRSVQGSHLRGCGIVFRLEPHRLQY